MPPKDIVRVYEVIHDGHYEFVKTYRTKRFDPVTRIIISKIYNGIFRAIFPGIRYRDINSKPKIWTRAALNKLNLQCDGWFIDGEMILEANRLQLVTREIPTVFQENEWRGSYVNLLTVVEIMLSILRYRFIYWFKS